MDNKSIEIKKAAKEKNLQKSATLFLELQEGCISCHVNHRKEIRNSEKWK